MIMTKQTKFILAVVIQLAIIFSIIIFKTAILSGGTDLMLKIQPIDPRDPLRGDYVTLQYNISNLYSSLAQNQPLKNNDEVYVTLKPTNKYWTAKAIQKAKPNQEEIFIKGRVMSGGGQSQFNILSYQKSGSSLIHIAYGIEEYFIQEGKGSELNLWGRGQEIYARVKVDKNGNAVLKQLYMNGNPWP